MNLHGIAAAYVSAVNPCVLAKWQKSTGSTTAADGSRTPSYDPARWISIQMQPMTYKDLMQVNGLNLGGEKRAVYVNHDIEAVIRSDIRGGDLITLLDGSVWLVVQPLENFGASSGWTKVAVVRQDDA